MQQVVLSTTGHSLPERLRLLKHGTEWSQAKTSAQSCPRKIRRVGERGAWRPDDDDLTSNRLKVGPEMNRALQGDDGLAGGLNAQMPEHLLIGSLALF